MKFSKFLITKIFFVLISSQLIFNVSKANAAEDIKIIYSIFSRTIKVDSLKLFAENGDSTRQLKRILNATGSPEKEIRLVLNKDFEIPITIASKLVYSEIGKVFLTRLSSIIHPSRADDERTGMLALRASLIKGIHLGNGKINLIKFFEAYPTKTVILDVNALSKVMNKVESISELLEFFTTSPLEKIKTN
ncbi:MAG: alpha/beta hydrolase [Prochlorococcus marinus CUG1431]|uniref:Alpha/beta hydrolase n=1 Tax=Prochlorococcus marinus CUG1433 TaxID=2774506 RepID=A0A9D9G3B4_PROMR|nr:alpha/beta hydrolase [Prochlorococcus marinus CUG1433]MBO6979996.1 alpha/beta hydrolase [Prochlorococcus marinus CUG1431]